MTHILLISGSAREGSFNTATIKAFESVLPSGTTAEHLDFSAVPLYNQDREANYPEEVKAVREKIRAADGVAISTPEYNRSIPGYLKNMIDWTSRPYGDGAWAGKPVFIMGASGGAIGTALAQYDLKKVMLYLDARVMGQPETYVGGAGSKFPMDEKQQRVTGPLTDEDTKAHLTKAAAAFVAFIAA